jgi:hypothetical protein
MNQALTTMKNPANFNQSLDSTIRNTLFVRRDLNVRQWFSDFSANGF